MLKGDSTRWLTEERLRVYPRLLTALYILGFLCWIALSTGNVDVLGKPLGADFISFYSAARLATEGSAHLAYDLSVHYEVEQQIIGTRGFGYPSFSYPPTYLILLFPFAYLPYLGALLLFQLGSLALYVLMIKKITNRSEAIMLCLSFPAVFITLGYGQNALLTTALLAAFMHYIDRRPVLAGFFVGLLTFKPHLGILIPLILVCSRRWRVFLSATITFLMFSLISYIAFGVETWTAFWDGRGLIKRVLHEELVPYELMQSVFTSMRANGISIFVSYLIHIFFAIISLFFLITVWSRKLDLRLQFATLIVVTLMFSPYILNYDFTILAVAIAAMATYCIDKGIWAWPLNIFFIAWVTPALIRSLNNLIQFPWASVVLAFLLFYLFIHVKELREKSK